MYKVYVAVFCIICYSIFYIVSFLFTSKNVSDVDKLPSAREIVVLSKIGDSDKNDKRVPLPKASVGKMLEVNFYNENISRKIKKTPLTYSDDYKTAFPRLSKEEILKAPVVKIIPMRVNGIDTEIVIVESQGLRYDASDGVIVHMPRDLSSLFNKRK